MHPNTQTLIQSLFASFTNLSNDKKIYPQIKNILNQFDSRFSRVWNVSKIASQDSVYDMISDPESTRIVTISRWPTGQMVKRVSFHHPDKRMSIYLGSRLEDLYLTSNVAAPEAGLEEAHIKYNMADFLRDLTKLPAASDYFTHSSLEEAWKEFAAEIEEYFGASLQTLRI